MIIHRYTECARIQDNGNSMVIWDTDGIELAFHLDREQFQASREELENALENDKRFKGLYCITPAYVFFEIEDECFLFQLIYKGNL